MRCTKNSFIPRLLEYLISNNTLFFLAHSPGLNPIEHLLDILRLTGCSNYFDLLVLFIPVPVVRLESRQFSPAAETQLDSAQVRHAEC